jgi:hypothetical protein
MRLLTLAAGAAFFAMGSAVAASTRISILEPLGRSWQKCWNQVNHTSNQILLAAQVAVEISIHAPARGRLSSGCHVAAIPARRSRS